MPLLSTPPAHPSLARPHIHMYHFFHRGGLAVTVPTPPHPTPPRRLTSRKSCPPHPPPPLPLAAEGSSHGLAQPLAPPPAHATPAAPPPPPPPPRSAAPWPRWPAPAPPPAGLPGGVMHWADGRLSGGLRGPGNRRGCRGTGGRYSRRLRGPKCWGGWALGGWWAGRGRGPLQLPARGCAWGLPLQLPARGCACSISEQQGVVQQ